MDKTVFVLLLGDKDGEPADLYQAQQQDKALAAGRGAGIAVEVACAPGYDQPRVLRKRLAATSSPVDAVLVEPPNVPTMAHMLKELKGSTGLMLLNIWDPLVEPYLADWGAGHPIGVVSIPHEKIGEIQGRQVAAVVPPGGAVLVVTGPHRSSAAPERLEALRSAIGSGITLYDTEAGQWTDTAGAEAFDSWYAIFKVRHEKIHAIAGQSDDLAVGAGEASRRVSNSDHADEFAKAKLLGVGCCPGFGRDLVDDGTLHASITLPPNSGMAIALLEKFWTDGQAIPPRSFARATPYPRPSVDAP